MNIKEMKNNIKDINKKIMLLNDINNVMKKNNFDYECITQAENFDYDTEQIHFTGINENNKYYKYIIVYTVLEEKLNEEMDIIDKLVNIQDIVIDYSEIVNGMRWLEIPDNIKKDMLDNCNMFTENGLYSICDLSTTYSISAEIKDNTFNIDDNSKIYKSNGE